MRNTIRIIIAAALLSGCASTAAIQNRDLAAARCAQGSRMNCDAVPILEQQVRNEESENGRVVAAGIVGVLLGAAVAAHNDYQPREVIFVRRCRWC